MSSWPCMERVNPTQRRPTNTPDGPAQVLCRYLLTIYSLLTVATHEYVKDTTDAKQMQSGLEGNPEVFRSVISFFSLLHRSALHSHPCVSHPPASGCAGRTRLFLRSEKLIAKPSSHTFLPDFLHDDNIWSWYSNLACINVCTLGSRGGGFVFREYIASWSHHPRRLF